MQNILKFLAGAAAVLVLTSGCTISEITPTSGTPGTGAAKSAAPESALAKLQTLTVKGKAPMTGYDRSQFGPAWKDVDHNGCDTRNDILARDLKLTKFKEGTKDCVVKVGLLKDPYTRQDIAFERGPQSAKVQIDHVVALGNVWVSGGQKLTPDQKEAIANDPLNLLAVDGPANMAKSDKDASGWLPKNKDFRCSYVARQIAVKSKYNLSVTPAEKQAMERVLDSCPGQGVPTE